MKISHLLFTLSFLAPIPALACTSLIAGKKATTDGSTLLTYAADSHTLYGELYSKPAKDHPKGAMRDIVDWDSGKYRGKIPEVAHTYSTIGNMNEHGVTISESTWGGRHELEDTTGLIDYGSLIYIALERSKTAREAIKVMTDLVKQYGYGSEGESFSIGDPNEVWIMDLIGKGGKSKGAVWVARRVPDDCISGHANQPRIHKFPLKDKSGETLYSPDVISFAKAQGYYPKDAKDADFSFSRAYNGVDASTNRGCDGRVWSFFKKHAAASDSLDKYLPWVLLAEGEEFPLWVKPEKPLSVRDMQWAMRDHFEDTPMDMTNDIGAGPYKVPYRWRPMDFEVDGKKYCNERAIATQQTGFSFVSQMNDKHPQPMMGILWFGTDDTNTTVYVPIYSCAKKAPHEFEVGNGDMLNLSWDASFWVNNYVANQAYHQYSKMIPDIRKVQKGQEDLLEQEVNLLLQEVPTLDEDAAVNLLNEHMADASKRYVKAYKDLGDYLLVKYIDGNVKKEKDGKFETTTEGIAVFPEQPGYNEEYYRQIVNQTGDHFLLPEKK